MRAAGEDAVQEGKAPNGIKKENRKDARAKGGRGCVRKSVKSALRRDYLERSSITESTQKERGGEGAGKTLARQNDVCCGSPIRLHSRRTRSPPPQILNYLSAMHLDEFRKVVRGGGSNPLGRRGPNWGLSGLSFGACGAESPELRCERTEVKRGSPSIGSLTVTKRRGGRGKNSPRKEEVRRNRTCSNPKGEAPG